MGPGLAEAQIVVLLDTQTTRLFTSRFLPTPAAALSVTLSQWHFTR